MKRNIIMILATLLIIACMSFTTHASTRFKSQGKIVFTNKTDDISDDVIFDASDFSRLETVCK